MRILFTITLFLSSVLLFLIEPMIAKMILPRFGGSPGVWNTSILFFQAALLAGYGYAHVATKWLGPRVQALTHIAVLLLPLLVLPFALPSGIQTGEGNPAPLVLLILTISVGLPFFVVSAGAPLLQRWFAATGDKHAKDPYFLYSASNLGSMLALLAYPFLVEPKYRLSEQARYWSYGYYALLGLMALCAGCLWLRRGTGTPIHEAPATLPPEPDEDEGAKVGPVTWKRRLRWILLAFCPSSLMLGVTTYLTSNIAPIPLLWVLPLALYLLTFIIAFAKRQILPTKYLSRYIPVFVVPLSFTIVLEAAAPKVIVPLVILHLLVVFAVSLLCHVRLAEDRPEADHLTEFYFYVSLGGVIGGLFNALIAPIVFNNFVEYPLILAAACAFRLKAENWKPSRFDWIYPLGLALVSGIIDYVTRMLMPEPSGWRSGITIGIPLILVFVTLDRPLRFSLSLVAFFVMAWLMQVAVAGRIIQARRSFFGVHRIEVSHNKYGTFHQLLHGNTVHGMQNMDQFPDTPLTYYYPSGPIGQIFRILGPTRHNIAIVGLGVGAIAAYGQPGQSMTYYEIDPYVVDIARDPRLFRFVTDCKANLNIKVGDARIELSKAPPASYDLIILDAFSSDSIPTHLLTRQAMEMYLSKLAPGGVIAFHISNQYLDLQPVLGNEATALHLASAAETDIDTDDSKGKFGSVWAIFARQESDFGQLRRRYLTWLPMDKDPDSRVWTDDYSNLAGALRMFKKPEELGP